MKNLRNIDVSKVTGVPQRSLRHYDHASYLVPTEKNPGKGKTSLYTPIDAVIAKILYILGQRGYALSRFATLHKKLKAEGFLGALDPYSRTDNRMYALVIFDDLTRIEIRPYRVKESQNTGARQFLGKPLYEGDYDNLIVINLNRIFEQIRKGIAKL